MNWGPGQAIFTQVDYVGAPLGADHLIPGGGGGGGAMVFL